MATFLFIHVEDLCILPALGSKGLDDFAACFIQKGRVLGKVIHVIRTHLKKEKVISNTPHRLTGFKFEIVLRTWSKADQPNS